MKKLDDVKEVMWKKSPIPGMVRSGIYTLKSGVRCSIVAGFEGKWEHVSVELCARRLPTWGEMCEVKDLFFDPEEEVVQIHPKKSEYVDMVEALHLWRPQDGDWSVMNGKGENDG